MMMLLKLSMSILMSLFMLATEPFHKIIYLTATLILTMFTLSYLMKMSWFSLMFLILMAGGLMVLFIYFTSMSKTPTKMFKMKHASFLLMVILTLSVLIFQTHLNLPSINETSICFLYSNWNSSLLMLFLIMYMIMILIISLELISLFCSSMRSKFYLYIL